jgi:hypothetical protein
MGDLRHKPGLEALAVPPAGLPFFSMFALGSLTGSYPCSTTSGLHPQADLLGERIEVD